MRTIFFSLLASYSLLSNARACIGDNVMRALSSYPYSASAFCSQYIQPTVTITEVIPTETFTTYSDVTALTTLIVTVTRTQTWTIQAFVTSTTQLYPNPIKRDIDARSVFIPPYLRYFSPYQISSGCSCFITPLPTPITVAMIEVLNSIWTEIPTTITTLSITTQTTTTTSTTLTQTLTTTVPNCFPIQGCILSNSSWMATPPSYSLANPLSCQDYCTGIGGCLSWQLGVTLAGTFCNFIGLAGWRAWDPVPGAMAVSPGVGGGNCTDFWIYERACPYVKGYPL